MKTGREVKKENRWSRGKKSFCTDRKQKWSEDKNEMTEKKF